MKTILHICLLVLIIASNLYSQGNDKLFLLMGYVDDFGRDRNDKNNFKLHDYQKVLYNIDHDTLVAYDTINAGRQKAMNTLVQFADHEFIYFEEVNMFSFGQPNYFSILDYEGDSIILRRYNSNWDASFLGYSWYLNTFLYNGEIFIMNEQKPGVLYGRALNRFFEKKNVELSDFQHIYNEGQSSSFQRGIGFLYDYPFDNFEKLKLTIGIKNYSEMPDAWVQIPFELRNTYTSSISVEINNERYFVGKGVSKIDSINNSTPTHYWILNKLTNNWDSLVFSHNEFFYFKNWNDWLYGTGNNKDDIWSMKRRLSPEEYETLIKKNDRDTYGKYNLDNGNPPNLIDKTGDLILYHIPTKKKIIWNTGNNDSEIIEIVDGKIYYRVYDQLRCMDIDQKNNNIDKSTDTLIVKDRDVIPYVHQIFFSSTRQEKSKEVWLN